MQDWFGFYHQENSRYLPQILLQGDEYLIIVWIRLFG